jgi:hypothetical protein
MSAPRDYSAFLSLLSALVPIDVNALKSERSIGGYLALRVAADQYLHNSKFAFDVEFYRDETAEGGVTTRLKDEPETEIARAWLVGAYIKSVTERFLTADGALDVARIQTAMAHDELLRTKHGEKIRLDRASLNAIALMRGYIPSRKLDVNGPAQDFDFQAAGLSR